MNQGIMGLAMLLGLIAGSGGVYFETLANRREVDQLIKYHCGLETIPFLLYKATSLRTQHAFHLMMSLVTFGGWLIPWWGLASANSALRRRLETAATQPQLA